MNITPEEFANWREDPVTQWVLKACETAARECQDAWSASSFETGVANPILLTELRTRADAYRALAETNWQGWAKTHGEYEEETNVVKIA